MRIKLKNYFFYRTLQWKTFFSHCSRVQHVSVPDEARDALLYSCRVKKNIKIKTCTDSICAQHPVSSCGISWHIFTLFNKLISSLSRMYLNPDGSCCVYLLLPQDEQALGFDGMIGGQILPTAPLDSILESLPNTIACGPGDTDMMPLPIIDEERQLCDLKEQSWHAAVN